MKRTELWLLFWLVLSLASHYVARKAPHKCQDKVAVNPCGQNACVKKSTKKSSVADACCCMEVMGNCLKQCDRNTAIKAVESLERVLEDTEVTESTPIAHSNFMAFLHKPKGPFRGLQIQANNNEVTLDQSVTDSKVRVQLPGELDVGSNNTIVFCMITWPAANTTAGGDGDFLENTLVGLSVGGRTVSGLQERVNISMNLSVSINDTKKPSCVFLNFSSQTYSADGCQTLWDRGQSHVTCSCDHLTYFAVLLVTVDVSPADQEILTYISLICSTLSLIALVLTVLLFISNRKVRADVSMRVHISLTVALILLNLHFLPSHQVAALSSPGLCLYMALSLHYSLLATFSWMALEGFHLYLLLVRVFNIYVRRYLLKLSVVGWGLPAVIVTLVVIIDKDVYGSVPLDSVNSNSTAICYISNNTVKMVTTVGLFSVVFVFNVVMLVVTIRRLAALNQRKEFGQRDCDRTKRDACSLLGITTLLGITWGLIFFSFGYLTTAALYPFCVLNSLQGFFILLWFLMSWRKTRNSAPRNSETRSTNS